MVYDTSILKSLLVPITVLTFLERRLIAFGKCSNSIWATIVDQTHSDSLGSHKYYTIF